MALIKYMLLLFFYVIQYTHCCWEADDNIVYCNNFVELLLEGQPEWTNISVININDALLHPLQANSFVKVPNIQFLSITRTINGIEPGAFNSLKNLTQLNLLNNRITVLPANIFNVKSLKRVLLLENEIVEIPADSFGKVDHVEFVNNSIGVIRANMFRNSAIRKLYLNGCDIKEIEDGSFMQLSLLFILTLSRNMLTSFNVKRLLGNSISLEVLYVDFNRLTSVPKDMFDGAERLGIISLEGNHIESIEDGAFSRLEYLSLLDLSDNQLVQIQPEILRAPRQPSLKALLLHDNRLTFINLALLIRAYRLAYFGYGGNPIQCPCSADIKRYLEKQNIQRTCLDKMYFSGDLPSCVIPLEYADMCLYDVALRNDLYELYKVARLEYSELQRDCNISNGVIKDIYGNSSLFYNLFYNS